MLFYLTWTKFTYIVIFMNDFDLNKTAHPNNFSCFFVIKKKHDISYGQLFVLSPLVRRTPLKVPDVCITHITIKRR